MASFGVSQLDAERRRLERRRALVDILQKQAMTGPQAPTYPGAQMSPYQGLAKMGEALIAALANRAQEKREKAFAEEEARQKQAELSSFSQAALPYGEQVKLPVKPETYTPTEVRAMPTELGPPMPTPPPGMDMAKVLAMQAPQVAAPQINLQPGMGPIPGPPKLQYGPPSASEQSEMPTAPRPTSAAMPELPPIAAQAPIQTLRTQEAQPAPREISSSDWFKRTVQALGENKRSNELVDLQRQALTSALMSKDPRMGTFMLENIQQGNKDLQAAKRVMFEAEAKAQESELQYQRGLIMEQLKQDAATQLAEARMNFEDIQNRQRNAVAMRGQNLTYGLGEQRLRSDEKRTEEDNKTRMAAARVRAQGEANKAKTTTSLPDSTPSYLISAASNAASQLTGDQANRFYGSLSSMINKGDYIGAQEYIHTSLMNSKDLSGSAKQQYTATKALISKLDNIENLMQEAGVSTGLKQGTIQSLYQAAGKPGNPKLADLSNKIKNTLIEYRHQMSGAAFSKAESQDYESVLPSTAKDKELNVIALKNLRDTMKDKLYTSIGGYLGEEFARNFVNDEAPSAEQPPPGLSAEELKWWYKIHKQTRGAK